MTKSIARLNQNLDTLYPTTGTIGYVALLTGNLVLNVGITWDYTTNEIIFASAPGSVLGTRFRFVVTGGSFPTVSDSGSAIDNVTDYFLIPVSGQPTKFKLARTLANAQAGTPVLLTFSNNGSGTFAANEQTLTAEDPITVLVNHEISGASTSYTRALLTTLPAASGGYKDFSWTYSNIIAAMEFQYKLVIIGGSFTIGDTSGYADHLFTETSDQTFSIGQSPLLAIRFQLSN